LGREAREADCAGNEARACGTNPAVVLADADVTNAVPAVIRAAFDSGGQSSTSCRNVFVDRRVFGNFLEQLTREVQTLKSGDPLQPDVDLGPVATEAILREWLEQRALGLEAGAELAVDGRRVPLASGSGPGLGSLQVTPRVFAGVQPTMHVARQPCLGPTLNILQVDGPSEAFDKAFSAPSGRCCRLFTRDVRSMLEFQERAPCALVHVNPGETRSDTEGPLQAALAREARQVCTRWQTFTLSSEPARRSPVTGADERQPDDPRIEFEANDLVVQRSR
jgi:acyl-CoA reductase-like NAD-dependent aldehyde dehydrogenase